MKHIDFLGHLAEAYPAGRRLPKATMAAWMKAAAKYVPPTQAPIVDLGAGSGRFSEGLCEQFGVPILAVEPAADMRLRHKHVHHSLIHLVGGRAEAIPCASRSAKAIWMSQVIHHLRDVDACARELSRVLCQGGRILLRGGFNDTERPPLIYRYFPSLASFATDGSQALAAFRQALSHVGLTQLAHEVIEQVSAESLRELYALTRLRARSTLQSLSDEEFAEGIARLGADAEAEHVPRPVLDRVDLVIFGSDRA